MPKQFYRSMGHAFRGILYVLRTERNFRIELVVAVATIFMALALNVRAWELVIVILMIGWVLSAELINTVVERVVDILKPRIHPYARLIKDIMAAVVLLSSIIALAIGFLIFVPRILDLFFLI